MSPEMQIAIPQHILSQKLDDETVLLNVETGDYFGLTPVASRAWDLLQQGQQPAQLPALLAEEFDAPCEQIDGDLATFFAMLREKQLIRY